MYIFEKASVERGTIAWSNGACIDPETLYEKLTFSAAMAKYKNINEKDILADALIEKYL
jgi:hypothetical protein